MTQAFGRECLLLKNVLNRGSVAGQIPAEMDSIMRAWVYYRMLTDRVETVYHREKVNNNNTKNTNIQETEKRGNGEAGNGEIGGGSFIHLFIHSMMGNGSFIGEVSTF